MVERRPLLLVAGAGFEPAAFGLILPCYVWSTGKGCKMKELTIDATVQNIEKVTAFVDEQLAQLNCPLKAQMHNKIYYIPIHRNCQTISANSFL